MGVLLDIGASLIPIFLPTMLFSIVPAALFVIVEMRSMSTDLIRLLYPCTSLCITLYCTIAIGFKMLRYRKMKGYAIIALIPALEIIAETALVYTAALVIMIGCHIALSSMQADGYSMVLVAVTAVSSFHRDV